jgi:hypothetical protein
LDLGFGVGLSGRAKSYGFGPRPLASAKVGSALRAEERMTVPLGGKGEGIRDFKFEISKGRKLLKQLMRFARGHTTLLKQGVNENARHAAPTELDCGVGGGSTNMALLRSLRTRGGLRLRLRGRLSGKVIRSGIVDTPN